jgi:hypothetical protein
MGARACGFRQSASAWATAREFELLLGHVVFGMFLRGRSPIPSTRRARSCARARLTIVRPGAFTDGPRTGEYRHGFPPSDKAITHKVSRADVAEFMLKQLTDRSYLRRTPALSY